MGERYVYEPVDVQSGGHGQLHRFVKEADSFTGKTRILSDERCQRDEMDHQVVLKPIEADAIRESADPQRLCGNCYPEG